VLAKKCAGENEWRSHLFLGLLQPLNRLEPEILMLSASEKREYSFNLQETFKRILTASSHSMAIRAQTNSTVPLRLRPSSCPPRSFNRPQHSL
jgi:hypothetical protein